MSDELDRAIEATKKFAGMFNSGKENGGGGGCTPEAQGIQPTTPWAHGEKEQSSADKISAFCDELKRFLLVKNEWYGDSALKPVKIFSKGDASDKIDIRMDDKMSRIIESDEQRMNDFVDLTGYLVLKCIDKGWTDFSELLD